MKNVSSMRGFVSLCCVGVLLAGCAPRPDSENAAEMARVFGECTFGLNTSALNLPTLDASDERHQIIEQIVQQLISSRYTQFPWKVKTTVLDSPVPNAFTSGGGYLAAFSGVYAMADDEASLAGIIAHELAHMAKSDPIELAGYLEILLAKRFEADGLGEYDSGQAIKTVVDFCLAIPGLVSPGWKHDLVDTPNGDVNPTYSDAAIPYVPFAFSQDPESAYAESVRDPNGVGRVSACNNAERDAYDEFVVINPDYYLETYPDADSLPPIPPDLVAGLGGLPGAGALWDLDPWLQFQHTSFGRYAECQADEAGIINLMASGYDPLALNASFARILDLFGGDEKDTDWRFYNHPSSAQRIEDNLTFIVENNDVFPLLSDLQNETSPFQSYLVMADRVADFEAIRDAARADLLGSARSARNESLKAHHQFQPITVADLAVRLTTALAQRATVSGADVNQDQLRCSVFSQVYEALTGKVNNQCLPVD